jgi:hypothetical protein
MYIVCVYLVYIYIYIEQFRLTRTYFDNIIILIMVSFEKWLVDLFF